MGVENEPRGHGRWSDPSRQRSPSSTAVRTQATQAPLLPPGSRARHPNPLPSPTPTRRDAAFPCSGRTTTRTPARGPATPTPSRTTTAHPSNEPPDIWSARNSKEPTATLLALPRSSTGPSNPAYRKWTTSYPENCTLLATIPCKHGPVSREEGWRHAVDVPPKPHWHLDLVMVWNARGQAELVSGTDSAHSLLLALPSTQRPRPGKMLSSSSGESLPTGKQPGTPTWQLPKSSPTPSSAHPGPAPPTLDGILRKAPRKFQGKPSSDSDAARPTPRPIPISILRERLGSSPCCGTGKPLHIPTAASSKSRPETAEQLPSREPASTYPAGKARRKHPASPSTREARGPLTRSIEQNWRASGPPSNKGKQ